MYCVRWLRSRKFKLHDFVIMPDHVHLLIEVVDDMTIEKAMQLIKGRFSHRLSHEFGYKGEVWQRGFTEVQVMNKQTFEAHRAYIAENPVKAGLAASAEEYPFCFCILARKKMERCARQRRLAGAKARTFFCAFSARLKPCPCYKPYESPAEVVLC